MLVKQESERQELAKLRTEDHTGQIPIRFWDMKQEMKKGADKFKVIVILVAHLYVWINICRQIDYVFHKSLP